MIAQFKIEEQYITEVLIEKSQNIHAVKENPTVEDTIKMMQGKGWVYSRWTEDHPKFAELRNLLEDKEYIVTCRNSKNGDRVIKEFYLNSVLFEVGEKFFCSEAMRFCKPMLKTSR